ncbi:hypothetical protein Nwi_0170 [Nitrobacter winogradskyi Nb-255]|uniref:Uncharacterized protein n=1 Tax=Nitrobacter winogradskyi (strain ATCC 25391 / DSM 10237 / CIP 104748 / NCIMB 11846 / Nb-255) TaxID=323098 RepID=Q3SWA3_NITWN|nr:hypothetical protein Nwi_0170 [Nitrobacter winogradskyi Nb-255]
MKLFIKSLGVIRAGRWPPGLSKGSRRSCVRALQLLTESEAELYFLDLTRFLHSNRCPSPDQARGHASFDNAIVIQRYFSRQSIRRNQDTMKAET